MVKSGKPDPGRRTARACRHLGWRRQIVRIVAVTRAIHGFFNRAIHPLQMRRFLSLAPDKVYKRFLENRL